LVFSFDVFRKKSIAPKGKKVASNTDWTTKTSTHYYETKPSSYANNEYGRQHARDSFKRLRNKFKQKRDAPKYDYYTKQQNRRKAVAKRRARYRQVLRDKWKQHLRFSDDPELDFTAWRIGNKYHSTIPDNDYVNVAKYITRDDEPVSYDMEEVPVSLKRDRSEFVGDQIQDLGQQWGIQSFHPIASVVEDDI
jgi:hypothetical protein